MILINKKDRGLRDLESCNKEQSNTLGPTSKMLVTFQLFSVMSDLISRGPYRK